MNENFVCIITGPNGAGKSSTSKMLASKFEKSAYIKVDDLRKMVIGSYLSPLKQSGDLKFQTALALKNTCALANNFIESGFSVFIDTVIGKTEVESYRNFFSNKPIKIFLLLPSLEILHKRFEERGGADDTLWEHTQRLHAKFTSSRDEVDWSVIDSSSQTLEETVMEIYKQI